MDQKPWIENFAAADVGTGYHHDAGPNSMLIQIMDPDAGWWPSPIVPFKEIHKFSFLDIEGDDPMAEKFGITKAQADEIAGLLRKALSQRMNVVVHCHAGICRSGAVAAVGEILGFRDVGNFKAPNLRVKHKLLESLALSFDRSEKSFDPVKSGKSEDIITRLRKRAEIRRQIATRKSVQEGKPDRLAELLEEAADEIERLTSLVEFTTKR